MKLILDAHLDLSMNALEWNRDLRQPVHDLRRREEGLSDKPDRARGTVAFPELRAGNVGIVVATQIARVADPGNPLPGWNSVAQAWAQTQGQLAWYRAMEAVGEMRQIIDCASLDRHLEVWNSSAGQDGPIGYILSLEGADSLATPDALHASYEDGLRALGPAHYGPGRYANGTNSSGGLNQAGKDLLHAMQELNIILDVTHLCDEAFWDALEVFDGHLWASHSLCRSLTPHNRQFSDEQIRTIIQRGAVIGMALDAWMMIPNWERGVTTPEATGIKLEIILNHIDHICQLAGNTRHVGIGTDLDGAFGTEQGPLDLDTIADLQKLDGMLQSRGYSPDDVENIFHANWIRFLRKAWSG